MEINKKRLGLLLLIVFLTLCNFLLFSMVQNMSYSWTCPGGNACIGEGSDYRALKICEEYCGKGKNLRLQFLGGTCTETCLCKTKWRCVSKNLTESEYYIFVTAYYECSDILPQLGL